MQFRQEETWYLKPNEKFYNRRLEIGICPDCESDIVTLVETRTEDNKLFMQTETGEKALKIIERSKKEVLKADKALPKGRLFGFVYGVNTERHNKYGKVTSYSQRACDWQGQRVLVRTVKIK